MPLPFILAGAAVIGAAVGAKKGYDGIQTKSLADDILKASEAKYNEAKSEFDTINDSVSKDLERLGRLQLQIGSDFSEFRKLSKSLLERLNKNKGVSDKISINIPQHKLNQIEKLAISSTAFLGKMAGAGAGGAAAAYAVYGGVMAFAAASTGTPIAALSGAAAYNATMAAIGGGSLAAGGLGMAGGAMVLGGVVAAPILAVTGWMYNSYAEDALKHAKETRTKVEEACQKLQKASLQLNKVRRYVIKIHASLKSIYRVFQNYFQQLKEIDEYLNSGGNANNLEQRVLRIFDNGYMTAAILADIITTPLFKPAKDSQGNAILNEDKSVQFETDDSGMNILNCEEIDESLDKAQKDIEDKDL